VGINDGQLPAKAQSGTPVGIFNERGPVASMWLISKTIEMIRNTKAVAVCRFCLQITLLIVGPGKALELKIQHISRSNGVP
jgi:hypothetical protein